ncbi:uncharacterized protein LOC132264188 [Phlebotomus argentipes]|uniref:uncharacterized protein LOC132264188 n=1 Tax=Phlebotomus argentipes TaxID=94469 RepID=UPI002893164C|nr:uncharacterized protein LOC132264188 [Phlebotomus argentipes]
MPSVAEKEKQNGHDGQEEEQKEQHNGHDDQEEEQKEQHNDHDDQEEEQEDQQSGRRFLVVERTDNHSAGTASLSPYVILEALKGLGDMKEVKCTQLKNHTLLIETQNAAQTEKILQVTTIGKAPVKVYEHPKLNRSRGVIKCWEFCGCDIEELLMEMKQFNVVGLRQIRRHMTDDEEAQCVKENRKKSRKDTGIFLVTFNTPDLPAKLNVGYRKAEVKLYIPKPLRCFRCQRLGHAAITCKENLDQRSAPKKGKKTLKCLNCKGPHESWDKTCPVYQKKASILKLKVENQVNYNTAMKSLKA